MESIYIMGAIGMIITLSLWLRVHHYRTLNDIDPKASPLSNAVQDLVSTAGGVYLSTIMLVSFLKLDIPVKVSLLNVSVDPIALLSISMAVIQPLFFRFFKYDK